MGNAPAMAKMGMSNPDKMDESAIKKAMSGMGGSNGGKQASSTTQQAKPNLTSVEPREVSGVSDEAKRGVQDVLAGLKEFLSINTWLGLNPETMTPQELQEANAFHQRYSQLDKQQQAEARKLMQEEQQREKLKQQEEQRKKQLEAQKKAQSIQMPSSPRKGAVGPKGNSSKKRAMHKLQQDRTTLGGLQGE